MHVWYGRFTLSPRYTDLGTSIRRARLRKGLTQDQLAERVGARGGRFTVIKWEQGLHKPTEYAAALARELGLSEDLFAASEEDDEEESESDMALARELILRIDALAARRLERHAKEHS